jgi:hypothetical protein
LEKILYPNREETKFLKKYTYLQTMKSNVKKSKKIICYSEKTKTEINERLNIPEQNIFSISPFFYETSSLESNIDIKLKHSLQ